MPRSMRRALLAHAVGLLFYLGGMLLFISVVIGAFFGEGRESMGAVLTGSLPVILLSLVLIMVGRAISWKYGADTGGMLGWGAPMNPGSNQSRLEQLGYRLPPDEDSGDDSTVAYEDGTVYAVCSECGTKNESDFRFCSNCSAELPE